MNFNSYNIKCTKTLNRVSKNKRRRPLRFKTKHICKFAANSDIYQNSDTLYTISKYNQNLGTISFSDSLERYGGYNF